MRFDVDGQRRTIGNELHDISRNEHFCELCDAAGDFSFETSVEFQVVTDQLLNKTCKTFHYKGGVSTYACRPLSKSY